MNSSSDDTSWHPNLSHQYLNKVANLEGDAPALETEPLARERATLPERLRASLARTPEAFPCFDFQYPPIAFAERNARSRSYEALWSRHNAHGPRAALYVHIPFCRARCSFCYFTVAANRGQDEVDLYLDALDREMAQIAPFVRDRVIESLYWGGGTPTYLTVAQIERLMASLDKHFNLTECKEFTVESTPTMLDEAKISTLRRIGLTRLSMGIQSFDDPILKRLNRSFERKDIERVVHQARAQGVGAINIDLMYGLPDQTLENWHAGLDRMFDMEINGCTIYSLDLHESTQFFRKRDELSLAPTAVQIQMYREAVDRLQAGGYAMINRNIFARDPDTYRHQNRRWENLPLIGLGASAQSYAPGVAYQNYGSIDQYIDALEEETSAVERAVWLHEGEEFYREAVCRLRFSGLHLADFEQRHGGPLDARFAALTTDLIKMGYLQSEDSMLRLTRKGLDYGNLISMFYFSDQRKQGLAAHPAVQKVLQLQALRTAGLTEDRNMI
ncbi:MAG: coproporphyrinogen-III oxidase family protein [Acidiferrobacter sp.]